MLSTFLFGCKNNRWKFYGYNYNAKNFVPFLYFHTVNYILNKIMMGIWLFGLFCTFCKCLCCYNCTLSEDPIRAFFCLFCKCLCRYNCTLSEDLAEKIASSWWQVNSGWQWLNKINSNSNQNQEKIKHVHLLFCIF